jgi:hypothetical protein
MDGGRFARWTRRHLGLAAGATAVSLVSLAPATASAKKKGKRKKKTPIDTTCPPPPPCPSPPVSPLPGACATLLTACTTTTPGPTCCAGLNCDIVGASGLRCCVGLRNACDPTANVCCSHLRCAQPTVGGGVHCCAPLQAPCEGDSDCCGDAGDALCSDGRCIPAD